MESIDQNQGMLMSGMPVYTTQTFTTTSSVPTMTDFQSSYQDQQPSLSYSTSILAPSSIGIPFLPQVPLQQQHLSHAPVETVTQSRKPRIKRPNPAIFDEKSVTSGGGYETASNPSQSQSNQGGAKVAKKRGPKPGSHYHSSGGSVTNNGIGYYTTKRPRGRPPLAIKKEPVSHSFMAPAATRSTADSHHGVPSYGYYSTATAPPLPSSAHLPRPQWSVLLHRLLSLLAGQGPLSLLDLGRQLPGMPRDMLQGALEFLLGCGIVEGHRVKTVEGATATSNCAATATGTNTNLPAAGTAIYALARNAARGPPLLFPSAIASEEGQEVSHNQDLTFFLQRLACQGPGHAAELEELEQTKARLGRLQQLESELMSMCGQGERVEHLNNEIRALVERQPQLAQEPLYRVVLSVLPPAV